MTDELHSGRGKGGNDAKGCGGIWQDGGPDVFVHFRAINGTGRRTLLEGQKVTFQLNRGEKGFHANNVTVV